jgi:mannosylglucosylglycerate synthase
MATHARLLQSAGHKPFIVAGRGDPPSIGLEGVIIPEIDSRHEAILKAQNGLRDGEEWALQEFERWAACIHDLLARALEGTDVCIVHNAFTLHKNLPLTVALSRLAEQRVGAKAWIAWCHDLAWNNPLYANELLPRWPWTPLKYPLPNVTYVAISEQRLSEMATLFRVAPTDIALVPNGIEAASYIPSTPTLDRVRERLRWYERDCVLLAPVRITRRKNLELAVKVAAAMREMGTNPLVVVTGPPGPHNVLSSVYMKELLDGREALGVEDHVAFLALEGGEAGGVELSDAEVAELYWWADALLLPSEQEGFGLPLLEAALARLPVFCSDIPVLREVGGEGANYFRHDGDPHEIAAMILNVLNKTSVAAYRRKVLSTYTWEAIFESRMLPLLYSTVEDADKSSQAEVIDS